jgi:hemerythrin-like metal-binding protein
MTTIIRWTDDLELHYEPLDRAHRDLVDVLAAAQTADDAALAQAWALVVDQARAVFDLEDHWMRCTAFTATPHHVLQHRMVLNLLHEGLVHARHGRHAAVREMAAELARWFPKHVQTLDAALAQYLRRRGAPPQPR